ncbi:MAG: cytochrome c-type biogenesis protein CcmH [Acidobacteria bacterium]|nr:cytochrome c-type biogenesis protein CcmH [Acidobacteriota bacterium]
MKVFSPVGARRLLALVALPLAATVLFGAGDDPVRVERLGHQLMCVCGCNQILLECNHVGCEYSTRMRSELMAAVATNNDAGVTQWFIDQYGATVVAAPSSTGFNRLAWVMPYAALLVGIGTMVLVARRWRVRSSGGSVVADPPPPSPELEYFREQVRKETGL